MSQPERTCSPFHRTASTAACEGLFEYAMTGPAHGAGSHWPDFTRFPVCGMEAPIRVRTGTAWNGEATMKHPVFPCVFQIALLGLVLIAGTAAHAAPFAYIANFSSNDVSVVDIATNTVTATIPVGSQPHGVAVNAAGTRAYISSNSGISVLDTATNTIIATAPPGRHAFRSRGQSGWHSSLCDRRPGQRRCDRHGNQHGHHNDCSWHHSLRRGGQSGRYAGVRHE